MDIKSFWNRCLCRCNLADKLLRDKCWNIFCIRNSRNYEVWIAMFLVVCNGCEDFLKLSLVVACDFIGLCWSDISTANKCIGVKSTSCALCINQLVHKRLSKAWLVTFVVAATSVADHIDDDILVKFLTIFECKTCNAYACFWVITINVEDRSFN